LKVIAGEVKFDFS